VQISALAGKLAAVTHCRKDQKIPLKLGWKAPGKITWTKQFIRAEGHGQSVFKYLQGWRFHKHSRLLFWYLITLTMKMFVLSGNQIFLCCIVKLVPVASSFIKTHL